MVSLHIALARALIYTFNRRYLKKHALSWHGLWWIVLLLYTHVLHTSMSILNCPILPGRDGSHVSVSYSSYVPYIYSVRLTIILIYIYIYIYIYMLSGSYIICLCVCSTDRDGI